MAHLFRPRLVLFLLILAEILNEIMEQSDVLGAGGIDPTSPHVHRTMGRQFTRVNSLLLLLTRRCASLTVGIPTTLNQGPFPVTVGYPSVVIAHLGLIQAASGKIRTWRPARDLSSSRRFCSSFDVEEIPADKRLIIQNLDGGRFFFFIR